MQGIEVLRGLGDNMQRTLRGGVMLPGAVMGRRACDQRAWCVGHQLRVLRVGFGGTAGARFTLGAGLGGVLPARMSAMVVRVVI